MNNTSLENNTISNSPLATDEGKKKCLEVIQLILDDEADAQDIQYFKERIKCCSQSMHQYDITKELKLAMKKVGYICPPDSLENDIKKCLDFKI